MGRVASSSAGDTIGGHRELQQLLEKIYRERGFDFRGYKESTLTRRLSRRMHARCAETYTSYAQLLDLDPTEYDKLFNDLTINVTSFFRDEVAFKALEEVVLPALTGKGVRDVRIWSAGCATGQEPYSIAMLLLELLNGDIDGWDVTLLATDIDAKTLEYARQGSFTLKEVEGIRPAWLDKYFVSQNKGFRVQPALRQLVTFKVHNLVSDSFYHDLDLVVCRNVLIYFTPGLQMQVLKGFHHCLKADSFLLLGKAEVPLGEAGRLFYCVDSSAKLYMKLT